MLPTKKQWKSWGLPSKYTALSLLLGIIGLIITVIAPIVSSDYIVEKMNLGGTEKKVIHLFPVDFNLNIAQGNIGKDLVGGFILQARSEPILISKNVKISSFTIKDHYFNLDQPAKPELVVKNVEIDKISLERISDKARFIIKIRPSFLYVTTYYTVYNMESAKGTKVGEVDLVVQYEHMGEILKANITVPIRLIIEKT